MIVFRTLIIVLTFALSNLTFAQTLKFNDYNGDKIIDTAFIFNDKSYKRISIPALKIDISHYYSSSSLTDSICVNPVERVTLSDAGIKNIIHEFFYSNEKNINDAAFNFLESLKKNETDDQINYRYKPQWVKGLMMPESYYFKLLMKNDEHCYIKFNGHNLKYINSFTLGEIEVLIYTLGVMIKKDNQFSWCFIGDNRINTNIEKLRWSTIDTVNLLNNSELLISQKTQNGSTTFYRINYNKGFIEIVYEGIDDVLVMITNDKIDFKSKLSSKILKTILLN
jgi:hypothetical protein